MDLSQLLIAARGNDANARKAAEDALAKLREQNLVRVPALPNIAKPSSRVGLLGLAAPLAVR